MKPRLRKIGTVWVCFTEGYHIPTIGASPLEAYIKWKKVNEQYT